MLGKYGWSFQELSENVYLKPVMHRGERDPDEPMQSPEFTIEIVEFIKPIIPQLANSKLLDSHRSGGGSAKLIPEKRKRNRKNLDLYFSQ